MQSQKTSYFVHGSRVSAVESFAPQTFHTRYESIFVLIMFFIACAVWQVAYLPQIIGTPIYSVVVYSGYAIFVLIFLMRGRNNLSKLLRVDSVFKVLAFGVVWQLGILLLTFFTVGELPELFTIIQMCSAGMLYVIGASLRYFDLEKFLFFLVAIVLAEALYTCVFSGAASFDVEVMEQSGYLVSGKNQLGGAWALVASLLIAVLVAKDKLKNYKMVLTGMLVLCLLFARCRTAFLAVVVSAFLLFVVKYSKKYFWLWILGTGFFGGLIIWAFKTGFSGTEFVTTAFLAGREGDDLDELSSGRVTLMADAIEGIKEHPIWGLIGEHALPFGTHNFFLRVWAQNGLLGGLGILLAYVANCFSILGDLKKSRLKGVAVDALGYFAIIVPFFISLGEPTYPYGPSTCTGLAFLFWGYSRQRERENEITVQQNYFCQ